MLVAIMISPGTTGTEEPPGMTALSLRPFHTPPHSRQQILERDAERQLEVHRASRRGPRRKK